MRVYCRGGPFADTTWRYSQPLPDSLMLFDAATLAYHEYRRRGHGTVYVWVGFAGKLPVPVSLDEREAGSL